MIVEECRCVLAAELHYQAVVYHCLREVGGVPPGQIGMNVKMWIEDVVSDFFKVLDLRKAPGFQGGFEPIPDVVIFGPDIQGDFRRRNNSNTLRQMIMPSRSRRPRDTRAGSVRKRLSTTYSNSTLTDLRLDIEDTTFSPL
ncbi:MAG: hypothetical protein WKF67_03800 [Rubrobacteraceae bacterium]